MQARSQPSRDRIQGSRYNERVKSRRERDGLGVRKVPAGRLHGVHTERALENFQLLGRPIHTALARALGAVKLAAVRTNRSLGFLPDEVATALEQAATELMNGSLAHTIVVDALQGGAGTSANMNVNEVLANRALELLGLERGNYATVSPLDHVNLHQSTNDVFPTALRVAALWGLRRLEPAVVALQESFQEKERALAHVVKVARTEMQDAVLTTLGREMSAYAEALNRDRWRLYKCEERLRVVNLGGTAIGTGLAAPRRYIFQAVEELREITGLGLARAENLVEATQNADVFVEVSGLLKALATTLVKISGDLRLMSSGPEAGLGEIRLPARQAGSSIMPGKVNPVIPEAVTQAALLSIGHDQAITIARGDGQPRAEPVPAAGGALPAGELRPAGGRVRFAAARLRGRPRGRRSAVPAAGGERDGHGDGAGAAARLRAGGRAGGGRTPRGPRARRTWPSTSAGSPRSSSRRPRHRKPCAGSGSPAAGGRQAMQNDRQCTKVTQRSAFLHSCIVH